MPVADRPRSFLTVTEAAEASLDEQFRKRTGNSLDEYGRFALLHPAAAFATKQWAPENFARTAEFLSAKGLKTIAGAGPHEGTILDRLISSSSVPVIAFDGLSLPEITALASRADLFVGNDSGIAHIAAAVNTPTVVIFGSSNRDHWRPWTPMNDVPNEIVFKEFHCQPCPGYECKEFGEPKCILGIKPEQVEAAIEKVVADKRKGERQAPAFSK